MKGYFIFILLLSIIFNFRITFAQEIPECTFPIITHCPCRIVNSYGGVDWYQLNQTLYSNGTCIYVNTLDFGINCNYNKIIGNGSGAGISIKRQVSVVVKNCYIENFYYGIYTYLSNYTRITNNTFKNNTFGVKIEADIGDIISRNMFIYNKLDGLHIESNASRIWDNFFFGNGRYNVVDTSIQRVNYFNVTKTTQSPFWPFQRAPNIIYGPFIGGNYYSDYNGIDEDGDGFGDTPFYIPIENHKDELPLVDLISPQYRNVSIQEDSAYSPSNVYVFSINWIDNVQIDKVIFELDDINYTVEKRDEYFGPDSSYRILHSVNYSINFTGLGVGTHYYKWYASDTRNNWNSTERLSFEVKDLTPPIITILSPLNETYHSNYIHLRVNLSEATSWIGYSLDTRPNVTLWVNKPEGEYSTYIYVPSGSHSIIIYANDTHGNMGASDKVYFTITKISGGCPYVFTWNGKEYIKDNNLLPKSEKVKGDVEDYYLLHQPLIKKNGKYFLLLKEFEEEYDYFDEVKLYVVDHDSDFKIALDPNYNILTYKNPIPPISAIDDKGKDVLELIKTIDSNNYYEGNEGNYIILNFGRVNSKTAKLVMRADPLVGPTRIKGTYSIHLQISNEEWVKVATVIPRNYWAMEIVDISNYLPKENELKIRLYFTSNHRIDFVGLDTSEQGRIEIKKAELLSAIHSNGENVKDLLKKGDKVYAKIKPGESIELEFSVPDDEWGVRDFILYSKGHYSKINHLTKILEIIHNFFRKWSLIKAL